MKVLEQIRHWTKSQPNAIAVEQLSLDGKTEQLSYADLTNLISGLTQNLWEAIPKKQTSPKVALLVDNGFDWVIADLTCLALNITSVPIPLAFSASQIASLMNDVDLVIVDQAGRNKLKQTDYKPDCPLYQVNWKAITQANSSSYTVFNNDSNIIKVIHTSGTTSAPKGVRIREQGLDVLLTSLADKLDAKHYQRYLSLVPLSLLIEQVTGIYITMIHGGTLVFMPTEIPLMGTASITMARYLECIQDAKPSVIVSPPILVTHLHNCAAETLQNGDHIASLPQQLFNQSQPPFIACGGAPISPAIVEQMTEWGIPIYEGYGLSENSSVVSWNHPNCYRAGTVGQPLAHVEIQIREGELWIRSHSLFAGYTNEDPSACYTDENGWMATGDLAEQDQDGYLTIKGRKKNVIVTSAGRNIAPEWVERQYKCLSFVRDVVLFGEGLSELFAVFIIDKDSQLEDEEMKERIITFGEENMSLIEQVKQPVLLHLQQENYADFFTVTGRPKRREVFDYLQRQLGQSTTEMTLV